MDMKVQLVCDGHDTDEHCARSLDTNKTESRGQDKKVELKHLLLLKSIHLIKKTVQAS